MHKRIIITLNGTEDDLEAVKAQILDSVDAIIDEVADDVSHDVRVIDLLSDDDIEEFDGYDDYNDDD